MKIVVIGLGSIGRSILKSLSGEGHTVTIIDEDKNLVEGSSKNMMCSVLWVTVLPWTSRRRPIRKTRI